MMSRVFQRFGAAKACLILFCYLTPVLPTNSAQEWKQVFDPYAVLTMHLELNPADWDRIRFDQPSQSESWIPEVAEALFWVNGETPIRVSVRRKGESDIALPEGDPQKVSLKIDMNAFVASQKWHGLSKLSLENGSGDPLNEGWSWMLHRLAWEGGFYGYEAAYSGWVRLFINGELKGVFVNAEQRDAQFLRNHGYDKESGTWLYKVDGSSALEVGVGNSPASTHLCYAPFNSGPGKGGSTGCPQPNLEEDLPQWIDLKGFFTLAAVNAFTENGDDLFSHSGKNSYAVDFDPPFPRTRLYFPWDLDTTIYQGTRSIYGNETYQTQLLMHPWFQRVYEQTLRDLIAGPFAPATLHEALDRLQAALGPTLDEDPYRVSDAAVAFQELHAWVDARVASVASQLTQPWIPQPRFNQPGGEVVAGFNLTMAAPVGDVYYSLDGSDPRAPGGAIAPSAICYSTPVSIEHSTHVTARAFDGTTWSALPATATFSIARYANALRITEIMYHPKAGALAEDEYEFLELKNTGRLPLDMSGFYFEGIDFTFPAGTAIAPGEYFVLVRNASAFSNRYPSVQVKGIYWGKLSDAGEKIRVRDPQGNTSVSVEYDDDPPWPVSPDGLGYSLVLAQPAGDPNTPTTWRASSEVNGSPGSDDPPPAYGLGVVVNEVLAHTDPPLEDSIELFNTGTDAVDISGWYLSDDFVRTNLSGSYGLTKYRFPANTVIAAGSYKVVYQRDFQTRNSLVPFALSELGETVFLSSADAAGGLTGYLVGAAFGASENGVSVGRYHTSIGIDFVPLSQITFGPSGDGAPNALPRVGPVVINEIMYNPTGGGSEFVELLNITSTPVDLSGWRIAGVDFTFPAGAGIAGNGLLLLLKTNSTTVAAFRAAHDVPPSVPVYGHDFVLENEGEALALEKPNSLPLDPPFVVERVRYNDKSPWPTEADGEGPSLERFSATAYGNDPVNWRTVQAGGSPGRLNQFLMGVAVSRESGWKYPDAGSDLGTAWRSDGYSDSGWASGDGPLGYGVPGTVTTLSYGSDPLRKPVTAYFRKEFVVNDPITSIANLRLQAMYDDGFVLYLNGVEILRSVSMPGGPLSHSTVTTAAYNSIGYETFDLSVWASLLRPGGNVLCAEVHQESPESEDLVWDASLAFDVNSAPTVASPSIIPAGGIFAGPVQVAIQTVPVDALIYYTLNGTEPNQSAILYQGMFTLESSAEVRARAYKPGYNQSGIATADFLVGLPGILEVLPAADLAASGPVGGPFAPSLIIYTLTNSGAVPLTWAGTHSQDWASLSAQGGTLEAGAATTVSVSINTKANSLRAGSYSDQVEFTNLSGGSSGILKPVELVVSAQPFSLNVSLLAQGEVRISLHGTPLTAYAIEASADLSNWTRIQTNTTSADGVSTVALSRPNPQGLFYRASSTQ